jgi:hypothetical protein
MLCPANMLGVICTTLNPSKIVARIDTLKFAFPNSILIVAAAICFADIVYASKSSDPGPLVTGILGILLLRRALYAHPPVMVIVSGYFLTALMVTGNQGLLDRHKLAGVTLILLGFACFILFEQKRMEKIKKLWGRDHAT